MEWDFIIIQELVFIVLRDAKHALQILFVPPADSNIDFQVTHVFKHANIPVLVVLVLQGQHAYHVMVGMLRVETSVILMVLAMQQQHVLFVLEDSMYQIRINVSNVLCLNFALNVIRVILWDALTVRKIITWITIKHVLLVELVVHIVFLQNTVLLVKMVISYPSSMENYLGNVKYAQPVLTVKHVSVHNRDASHV